MAVRRGYLDTVWGQVHYPAAGEAGPFLFLFHLTPFSSRQFEDCLPHLASGCRAFALDTPGYGQSDPPPAPTTIEHYSEWLLAAIDRVTPGPFAVAGFSTGAAIGLDVARRVPKRVTHLVLSTTPLMPKQELAQLASANVGQPEMAADGSHLVKAWAGRQGVWGRDLDRRILHAATSDIAAVYDRFHWGLIAVMNCDVGRLLERVACPSLFLTGALDAHVAHNEAAARVVRGSRYELLAQATAPISATQPKAYAERVLRFVHGDGAS